MTILTRLEQWKDRGILSPGQHTFLAALSRGEPFSLFLEHDSGGAGASSDF